MLKVKFGTAESKLKKHIGTDHSFCAQRHSDLAEKQNLLSAVPQFTFSSHARGTSALHLNEATWINDGSNELIVDFLFALVLFLDSTQPFKISKTIFFFWIKQTNDM